MTLSFLRRRTAAGQTTPQSDRTPVPVNVTAAERQRPVIDNPYPLDRPLDPDLSGCDVAHIRAHLPNAAPSPNLRAARAAKVLDQERAFLVDTSGKVPPEKDDLIEALGLGAERLRDGIVIGGAA